MDRSEKQILETFAHLARKKVSLHSVVLFGSRARGDADPDSDMDVLVIVDDLTEKDEDYISECAWEAGFESGIVVVPVVFSRLEWENGPERYSLLAEAVESDGVYM
jgi:predicted nucleotidyltransferase